MVCEKCEAKLPYGAKFCNTCGCKIEKTFYENDYGKTIWGKLDKAKDKYDKFFLKKITGSIIFKIASFLAVLAYLFFTLYGTFMGIRIQDSKDYSVEYNRQRDEYYICPEKETSLLEIYVPVGTEKIVFNQSVNGDMKSVEYSLEEYKEKGYSVSAGKFDNIVIEAVKKDKILDNVTVVVVNE